MNPPEGISSVVRITWNQFAQPVTFTVRLDLARHADVFNGRHVNQETAGQGNVRSNASALFGDGFLGNLDQYFLTLL